MSERLNEIKKLTDIAADRELPPDLRTKAIEQLGSIGTHEALLALLELAAKQESVAEERDFALKEAREIIMSGH